MLDSDTKRRIDTARDILVGKVPDPKSQVEQITIALIYKFMDDMDAESEELGGARKFFTGDFARYGWAKLMRSGLGGHETLNLYAEAIARMPENPGIPLLFRDIFKNAFLPYRDPETLRSFLKVIDEFSYDHSERLGDAFEYLLSVLGSQGDAGQFRTPRHIIDFIVAVVDPKKNETILDPACGTAGFLISAYKHILQANTGADGVCSLTPDERAKLAQGIRGYDISPDMVRLSLVNLYLHNFQDPHIFEYDTLTSQERWNETADVILANPPFMTPKGGITSHNRFSVNSKRSEVLFVDYIIEHLSSDGHGAVIVPEGIHFVAHTAYKHLRTALVEKGFLWADITLPHCVFKPYASVKTHVLFFDRKLARGSEQVLFIELENDGFSQGDTREPVSGTQIPLAVEVANSFKLALLQGEPWSPTISRPRSYTVSKQEILASKDIHLLGRWYDLPNRTVHRPDVSIIKLGDCCDIRDGLTPNMGARPGKFPLVVPAAARKTADHMDYDGPAVCVPLVSAAGHGKADIKRLHFEEGEFALATTMCALFPRPNSKLNPKFLFLYLSGACKELLVPLMCGATNVTMSSNQLADVPIPVPAIEIQNSIVEAHLLRSALAQLELAAKTLSSMNDRDALELSGDVIARVNSLKSARTSLPNVSAYLPTATDEVANEEGTEEAVPENDEVESEVA